MTMTGKDLQGFDTEAVKLLLWAQSRGAKIKITKRGHAMVYGPDGGFACIPPNLRMGNRSSQNSRASIARLFRQG